MARHKLTHSQEVKGGKDSHMAHSHAHHKKMALHHMKKAMEMKHHKKEHISIHDRMEDRKNLAKARRAR